jgi:hypothetical protein
MAHLHAQTVLGVATTPMVAINLSARVQRITLSLLTLGCSDLPWRWRLIARYSCCTHGVLQRVINHLHAR